MVSRALVLVLFSSVLSCASSDSTSESADPRAAVASRVAETAWCASSTEAGVKITSRYTFKTTPKRELRIDRIADFGGGDVHVYRGGASYNWSVGETNPEVKVDSITGYFVALPTGTTPAQLKTTTLALRAAFAPGHPAYDYRRLSASACAAASANEEREARPMAELQIRLGQLAAKAQPVADALPEFERALELTPPFEEVVATPELLTAHAWCAWEGRKVNGRAPYLSVATQVYQGTGVYSTTNFAPRFRVSALSSADIERLYADQVARIPRSKWAIVADADGVPRVHGLGVRKIVRDRNGHLALFGSFESTTDFPLVVPPQSVFVDCRRTEATRFDAGWNEWLSKVLNLQAKALSGK